MKGNKFIFYSEHPKITTQPTSCEDVFYSTTVTFTVQATGAPPLCYHWESSESGVRWKPLPDEGGRVRGMETATLTILEIQKSDEVKYRCIVSNSNGSESTEPAILKLAGE